MPQMKMAKAKAKMSGMAILFRMPKMPVEPLPMKSAKVMLSVDCLDRRLNGERNGLGSKQDESANDCPEERTLCGRELGVVAASRDEEIADIDKHQHDNDRTNLYHECEDVSQERLEVGAGAKGVGQGLGRPHDVWQ